MSHLTSVVRVGIGVIIYNSKDEILIGKRKSNHGKGLWGLPGGHLELGETPEKCAIRETLEESSVTISTPHIIASTNDIFSDNKHYITLFIEATLKSGTPKCIEKHSIECWEWHKWKNLPTPLFLPIESLINNTPEKINLSPKSRTYKYLSKK